MNAMNTDGGVFWAYWYFHLPNYVIAALIYTLLARVVLGLFVPHDWPNYIWRFFVRATNPVLAVVGLITPRIGHGTFLPVFAIFWLAVLRLTLWLALTSAGLLPQAPGV